MCFNQFSIYIGGAGGFGGKKRSEHAKPLVTIPTRAPDASIREKTSVSQAAIYRLSGDSNPIHIDPDFAQLGGTVRLSSYFNLLCPSITHKTQLMIAFFTAVNHNITMTTNGP